MDITYNKKTHQLGFVMGIMIVLIAMYLMVSEGYYTNNIVEGSNRWNFNNVELIDDRIIVANDDVDYMESAKVDVNKLQEGATLIDDDKVPLSLSPAKPIKATIIFNVIVFCASAMALLVSILAFKQYIALHLLLIAVYSTVFFVTQSISGEAISYFDIYSIVFAILTLIMVLVIRSSKNKVKDDDKSVRIISL